MRDFCKEPRVRKWLVASIILLSGCGSGAPTTVEELDLVVTAFQPEFAFASATTYLLPDKVVVITDPGTTAEEVDPAVSQHVLEQVGAQLNSRGYVALESGSETPPDLFVEVSKMTTVNADVYYTYWPSYWSAYYAPYYGYGVGWAATSYPYVSTSAFGSLIINVTNPNQPNTEEMKIPSVWAAVLNGIVDESAPTEIQRRVDNGVSQAFVQSPYFTRSSP